MTHAPSPGPGPSASATARIRRRKLRGPRQGAPVRTTGGCTRVVACSRPGLTVRPRPGCRPRHPRCPGPTRRLRPPHRARPTQLDRAGTASRCRLSVADGELRRVDLGVALERLLDRLLDVAGAAAVRGQFDLVVDAGARPETLPATISASCALVLPVRLAGERDDAVLGACVDRTMGRRSSASSPAAPRRVRRRHRAWRSPCSGANLELIVGRR